MIIGIDTHAAEKPGEGNCTYIRNLAENLIKIDRQNRYIFYGVQIRHPFYRQFKSHPQVLIRGLSTYNPFLRIPFCLGRASFQDSLDILHVQYIAPPIHKGKRVVTIHDLGFLHVPETFSRFERFRSRIMIRRTALKAAQIITGSHFSRNDIIESYGIPEDRITAVPYGPPKGFSPSGPEAETDSILKKYEIRKPYILSVSRLNPRKNLAVLIDAMSRIIQQTVLPHLLILAGKKDYSTPDLIKNLKQKEIGDRILFPGFIAEEDLPALYRGADLFVCISQFEGFGFPILEAMQSGIPVLISNAPSLVELAGRDAITVSLNDVDQITAALIEILSDSQKRKRMAQDGIKRSLEFDWENTAHETLKIYKAAASD